MWSATKRVNTVDLENMYSPTKIGFDTTANGPSEVLVTNTNQYQIKSANDISKSTNTKQVSKDR